MKILYPNSFNLPRQGIVHRLDKDTTGLMVIAKTQLAYDKLKAQFVSRSIARDYYAMLTGVCSDKKIKIDNMLGRDPSCRTKMRVHTTLGKQAITYMTVLQRYQKYTWVKCQLATGRTHQIRAHMLHLGWPIVGDKTYGVTSTLIDRQMLHAAKLSFVDIHTNKKRVFVSELPADIMQAKKIIEEAL